MRRFFVVLTIFLTFKCFSYDRYLFYPEGQFIFKGYIDGPYSLSDFSFKGAVIYGIGKDQQEILIGSVEKLSEWARTYVFKIGDTVISTHRASLLSSGTLFDRFKIYEVYDESNKLIGFIEGVWDTHTAACFLFYKENHECFAKASLDFECSKFTIGSCDDEILITGVKTFNVSYNYLHSKRNEYYWKIKKEKEHPLSASFLWPFIGFVTEAWWR